MRSLVCSGLFALCPCALFAQAPADIHASARTRNQTLRTGPVRDGRYEIRAATMLDLIRIAWNFDADRILGGPEWLELDKFDVIAKVPADLTPEA